MEQALVEILSYLANQFPIVMTILSVVGLLRFVFKPVMAIVENVVAETPSKKDDEALAKFKTSKVYSVLVWIVDLLSSVKLKLKK